MGIIGGSRHLDQGQRPSGHGVWRCPSCQAENGGRLEDGCSSCGSGSAAQAATAMANRQTDIVDQVTPERIYQAVLGDGAEVSPRYFVELEYMTEKARLSVAAALAFAGEHGEPLLGGLSKVELLKWGRLILAAVQRTDATPVTTPDTPSEETEEHDEH